MAADERAAPQPTPAEWAAHFSTAWLAGADHVESQLSAVDPLLFAAAQVQQGERVLDVGCGRGSTTAVAAALAGPTGRVCGVDVAEPLVDAARTIHDGAPGAPIDWVGADAQTHEFEPGSFDVILSRFGLMFFADPVAAFENLRRASRPGGRLCSVVWAPWDQSEWSARPVAVASGAAREVGYEVTVPVGDFGPFRFGVEAVMVDVLTQAGWAAVRFEPYELAFWTGGLGATAADATRMLVSLGSVAPLLHDAPPEVVEHVTGAVEADLQARRGPAGIRATGRVVVVRAVVPDLDGR